MEVCLINEPVINESLEFTDYIFEITASTKVLLEMSRHREMSMACKSSRYCLSNDLKYEEPFCSIN